MIFQDENDEISFYLLDCYRDNDKTIFPTHALLYVKWGNIFLQNVLRNIVYSFFNMNNFLD